MQRLRPALVLSCWFFAVPVRAQPEPAPPGLPAPPPPPPPPLAPPPPPAPPIEGSSPAEPPAAAPVIDSHEALEAPYTEPPTSSRPVSAAQKSSPQPPSPDIRPRGPIRAQRRLALLGEVSWNGLAGFGAILSYHATPHVSLDLGGGFSLLGWKGGVRGRYNFSTDNLTPFVGVGFNATTGLGQVTADPKDDSSADANSQPFTIEVKPSYLAQAVVGFEFVHRRGFTMQGALGYARLLNKDNVRLIDGSLTSEQKTAVDVIFKSGPVISVAFGSSFK